MEDNPWSWAGEYGSRATNSFKNLFESMTGYSSMQLARSQYAKENYISAAGYTMAAVGEAAQTFLMFGAPVGGMVGTVERGAVARYGEVVPNRTQAASGNRASRITFTTDGMGPSELGPISLRNFGNLIGENPISYAALRQAQRVQERMGGRVTLQFGDGPPGLAGEVGKALDGSMEMDLYMLNRANLSAKGAASTLVHESSHYMRGARGFEIGTQVDEYMAFRRAKLFELGRRPSFDERKAIWINKILNDPYYSTRPVGGDVTKLLQ